MRNASPLIQYPIGYGHQPVLGPGHSLAGKITINLLKVQLLISEPGPPVEVLLPDWRVQKYVLHGLMIIIFSPLFLVFPVRCSTTVLSTARRRSTTARSARGLQNCGICFGEA
ncbi:hypothetical protein DFH07DRAFT_1065267 [Mycena maculata]|uniref:Uncharacterized protein n=1 Tax=Mycena maculata TaxID=230809 RepID=A0AAD7I3Q0_9AGAR|nr:hypothetical protein DFH07DRAFT_1065267 [Mycena maculata]